MKNLFNEAIEDAPISVPFVDIPAVASQVY